MKRPARYFCSRRNRRLRGRGRGRVHLTRPAAAVPAAISTAVAAITAIAAGAVMVFQAAHFHAFRQHYRDAVHFVIDNIELAMMLDVIEKLHPLFVFLHGIGPAILRVYCAQGRTEIDVALCGAADTLPQFDNQQRAPVPVKDEDVGLLFRFEDIRPDKTAGLPERFRGLFLRGVVKPAAKSAGSGPTARRAAGIAALRS